MREIEKILARFILLFLKHLNIELNNSMVIKNSDKLPKKSILRNNFSFNQKKSSVLTSATENVNNRRVHFTHIDSYEFDPKLPCRFTSLPRRELFYSSANTQQMRCLCHYHSKTNLKNKSKIKLQRQKK